MHNLTQVKSSLRLMHNNTSGSDERSNATTTTDRATTQPVQHRVASLVPVAAAIPSEVDGVLLRCLQCCVVVTSDGDGGVQLAWSCQDSISPVVDDDGGAV
jgi:hypothetical protein